MRGGPPTGPWVEPEGVSPGSPGCFPLGCEPPRSALLSLWPATPGPDHQGVHELVPVVRPRGGMRALGRAPEGWQDRRREGPRLGFHSGIGCKRQDAPVPPLPPAESAVGPGTPGFVRGSDAPAHRRMPLCSTPKRFSMSTTGGHPLKFQHFPGHSFSSRHQESTWASRPFSSPRARCR